MIVDAHCHLFNADDLPIRGFVARVGLHHVDNRGVLVRLVDRMTHGGAPGYFADRDRLTALLRAAESGEESVAVPTDLELEVDQALAVLPPEERAEIAAAVAENDGGAEEGEESFSLGDARRAVRWAKLYARSRADLPADYRAAVGTDVGLAIAMMVDLGAGLGDRAETTLRQQVELAEQVSRASMYDALPGAEGLRIHHFAGFDPLHELAARKARDIDTPLDVVKDAVTRYGIVGVKVYPQMGWQSSGNVPRPGLSADDATALDAIVDELAGWCAEQAVPITAHCNRSNYASQSYDGFGAPDQWLAVLQKHPELHLNLGHFGGAHAAEKDYAWGHAIAAGMARFEHLYADVSCHRIDDPGVRDTFLTMLGRLADEGPVAERLLFGTDWFMMAINPDPEKFVSTYADAYRHRFGAEAVDRFLTTNALAFLGFTPTTANGQRLAERYERFEVPAPAWLGP